MKKIMHLSVVFGLLSFLMATSSCVKTKYGCTRPSAINYDPNATNDDGSCKISGCTDSQSPNYNSIATIDDGSCIDLTQNLIGTYKGKLVDADTSLEYPYYNEEIRVTKVDNKTIKIAPYNGGIADPFNATVELLSTGNYALHISYQINSNSNIITGYNSGLPAHGSYEKSTGIIKYVIDIDNLDIVEAYDGTKQ